MVVVDFFYQIVVIYSCQGSSFFQGLLILANEVKDRLHYSQADAHDCRKRARRFIRCHCCGERCLVSVVVHKGQPKAFLWASASLLTALVELLYGADDHGIWERARRFLHCPRSFPNSRCFGDRCPVSDVVHKGQLQAFLRASASLLTALVVHLHGRWLLYFLQRGHPSFYFDLP